ncbi:MAG: hypothetical protein KY455_05090 [Euryarchaeota archaeon]|nr:hypothetical protein [Euryarchaeota archaeon]
MQDSVTALKTLGLTEWSARAYEALVGLGETSATTVAEAAQLPRTKVYAILDDLVKDGWAEAENTRPKTFRAVDPGRCIERGRVMLLESLDRAQRDLEALYKQEGVRFGGPMWTVVGEEAIHRRMMTMTKAARDDLFMGLPFGMPDDEALFAEFEEASRRGARVRVLVPSPEAVPERLRERSFAEIRVGPVPLRALFVDDKQAFVTVHRTRTDGAPDYRGIWNPHPDMVEQLRWIERNMWEMARNVGRSP